MTTPTNARELFDDMIPRGLEKFPDKAREVGSVYAFKILGEEGGEWVVDLTGDPPTCVSGPAPAADCTIECEHDDFKQMLSDPNSGMELFMSGRLRVSGDPMLATKLQQFFRLAA